MSKFGPKTHKFGRRRTESDRNQTKLLTNRGHIRPNIRRHRSTVAETNPVCSNLVHTRLALAVLPTTFASSKLRAQSAERRAPPPSKTPQAPRRPGKGRVPVVTALPTRGARPSTRVGRAARAGGRRSHCQAARSAGQRPGSLRSLGSRIKSTQDELDAARSRRADRTSQLADLRERVAKLEAEGASRRSRT